jgi:phosphatidylglycerol lysyltransferase
MQHGWNATAYQIVNPGIQHWFAEHGDAVIGYVSASRTRVVAGAPVCAIERLRDVTREFERDAFANHQGVVYFGAEKRLEDRFRDSSNHSMALLGAQPAWNPSSWLAIAESHSSLRAQFNRAINKGVFVEEWTPRQAATSRNLGHVLERWLSGRSLPPLHFLVEPSTLERLDDRRVFVARRRQTAGTITNPIVAFAVLSPVPARSGWLVEQFPRIPDAPNGTIELLMREAVRTVAREAAKYLTLGLAPLAQRDVIEHAMEPRWLRVILGIMRDHGRRFYNFEGLERFKSKFGPDRWEPVYAIQNRSRFSPRALYAIAGAFASGSPIRLGGAVLRRAIVQEIRWLKR